MPVFICERADNRSAVRFERRDQLASCEEKGNNVVTILEARRDIVRKNWRPSARRLMGDEKDRFSLAIQARAVEGQPCCAADWPPAFTPTARNVMSETVDPTLGDIWISFAV